MKLYYYSIIRYFNLFLFKAWQKILIIGDQFKRLGNTGIVEKVIIKIIAFLVMFISFDLSVCLLDLI